MSASKSTTPSIRAVLYTDDMEPITVVEVAGWAVDMVKHHGYVRFAVLEPFSMRVVEMLPVCAEPKQVVIYGEWLQRNGTRHLMLFTRDEENALLLKSVFLPGQQRQVNEEKARAFARGFLYALSHTNP